MSASLVPSLNDLAADDVLVVQQRCRSFEAAWKDWQDGPRPVLEDWLVDGPLAVRAVLLAELLRLELDYRRGKANEQPVLADYLDRFRADESLLRRALAEPERNGNGLSQALTKAPRTAHRGIEETDERVPPGPEPLPEYIGRYRVERVLGQGGFGIVYLAHDDQLRRRLAIKVPHRRLVARPEDAEAYLAEARTVANLDHPNIVPVHDVGSTDELPCYVVSKYIDGTDLARRLNQSRLAIDEAIKLVATVAEALHHAHRQGLVHRDVKPGNILLDSSGKPFVADFGLALREQDVGKGPRYAGTPAYMSPEQARGDGPWVDGRSDIFSLGVVFYELLVGRRPFHAESWDDLLEQISTQEVRPPRQWDDTIPKELEHICLKALAKRAAERYTTAKDLADDLRHFLGSAAFAEWAAVRFRSRAEEAVSTPAFDQRSIQTAPTPATTMSAAPPNRTRRKLLWGLTACVVLAGLGLAVWLVVVATGPNADLHETGPRSLDSLKRDAPFQLLERKPLAVGWNLDNPRWQLWNSEEKLLQITGGPSRLLVVGTTKLPSYDFEVAIKQAPWTGEVGIFWGLHEDTALKQQRIPRKDFAWFHFLRIEHRIGPNGQAVRFVHRGKGSLRYNQQMDVAVTTTSFFVQPIERLSGLVRLKIEVKGNRLRNAELGREFLTELCSNTANTQYRDVPYDGALGILALSHTATFSEVRFVARSNP